MGLEDAVLFAQVLEDALLVGVEAAGDEDGEDVKERRHGVGDSSCSVPGRGGGRRRRRAVRRNHGRESEAGGSRLKDSTMESAKS